MKTKAILGALCLLLAGIILGAGSALLIVNWRVDQIRETGPGILPEIAARKLAASTGLTSEEQASLRKILATAQAEIRAIRRASIPKINAALETARQEVRSALPAKKADEVLARLSKVRDRWSHWEPKPENEGP